MKKLALLLVESALLLALLEVAIRAVVAPQIDVPHLRVHPEGYYTWYPGSRFTYHNLAGVVPPSAPIRINTSGLRGDDVASPKPRGEHRVLVVGDSYTAAVQLPEEDIFTTVLETRLHAARPAANYRVVNAGVNGAGTAHELLYLRHEGAALAPDVVVLQFAFNDVADTRLHGGFRATDTGVALRDDLQHPPFWRGPLLALRDAVGNRSLAFYLLYRALAGSHPQPASAADLPPVVSRADPDVTLVARLAAEVIQTANALGAPVIVLTVPAPLYIHGGDPMYDQAVAAFGELVAGSTNQLVVTDPIFRDAEERGEPVFLANDGHLNAAGHRVVADALAAAVLRYDVRD